MPKLRETSDAMQFTGKGWLRVDSEAAQAKLREVQQELAVRQAELVGEGASDD